MTVCVTTLQGKKLCLRDFVSLAIGVLVREKGGNTNKTQQHAVFRGDILNAVHIMRIMECLLQYRPSIRQLRCNVKLIKLYNYNQD